ncbi:synaptic vesicle glycoprotein 2C-like isoform X2 [Sipha flava]|nr:synaptic vesicle glycoprotein 2C-like isoform X2 [Sipha flava]
MVFGAYFWGVCGDMKGRRFVILASMGMDALCSVLSSLTQDALYFLIIRIGNGFAIIGATCMIYVYFGEFLSPNKRDIYLLSLEIFWVLGIIAGQGIAMVIIPSDLVLLSNTYIVFNAWRAFIFLSSIPSFIGFILIYLYPESPRYLMYRGRMIESRDILEKIYIVNNKNTVASYPVTSFTQTYSAIGFNRAYIEGIPFMTNLKIRLITLKNGHKTLFTSYGRKIIVTSVIEFCLMASYIAVLLWLPELFSRYYEFKKKRLEDVYICTASEWVLKYQSNDTVREVSADAYFAAMLVSLSTVPPIIITGILIKYVNKKILLCMSCGIPIISVALITITKNDLQAEIMCCIFEGFTTLTEPILFVTMVELFPSNVKGVAFSMTVMIGRLGAIFGIIVFGILIDKNCTLTFYLIAALLFIAFLATGFLPRLKIGGSH